jgi:hypothetical protein
MHINAPALEEVATPSVHGLATSLRSLKPVSSTCRHTLYHIHSDTILTQTER